MRTRMTCWVNSMNDQWYNLSGGLALYALSLTQCSIHNFRSKILSIWVEIPRRILYQNFRLTIMELCFCCLGLLILRLQVWSYGSVSLLSFLLYAFFFLKQWNLCSLSKKKIMDIIINGLLSFFTRESKSTWAMWKFTAAIPVNRQKHDHANVNGALWKLCQDSKPVQLAEIMLTSVY